MLEAVAEFFAWFFFDWMFSNWKRFLMGSLLLVVAIAALVIGLRAAFG